MPDVHRTESRPFRPWGGDQGGPLALAIPYLSSKQKWMKHE